jgi:major membrane immunogen (membrane-anchored lipoprotein)
MKKSIIKTVGALAVVCIAVLCGGCGMSDDAQTGTTSQAHRGIQTTTNWTKWGAPKITSDMWDGTTVWQMRTNLDTGEVELRAQTATAKGGYYK